jgi:hypothetical protein
VPTGHGSATAEVSGLYRDGMTEALKRSREAEAFLDARQHIAPQVTSTCAGWTAHDVTAHLAAGAAEVTRHLEPYLAGDPVPRTRGFEEREAPYRALGDAALMHRLEIEEQRVRAMLGEVLAAEPDAVIPWTGRQMPVAKFVPHLRSEFAIHRWDIAGDDATGDDLLAQPELTHHAVEVLGRLLLARGRTQDPVPDQDFHVRLRTPDAPDVRVTVESGHADLQITHTDTNEPYLELDAAARTLVLWGRRPDQRDRIRSHLTVSQFIRLRTLLSGY